MGEKEWRYGAGLSRWLRARERAVASRAPQSGRRAVSAALWPVGLNRALLAGPYSTPGCRLRADVDR
jgi:hypothetical protein